MGGGDDREEEEGSNTGEGACGVGYETGPMSEPPDTATQARPASAVVEDVPDSPVPVEEERREEREEEEEDAFAAPIVKRPPLSRRGSVSPSVGKRSRAGDASSVDRRVADASRECSICYENWTSSGKHRICCLSCGHLFGESCIAKWVAAKKRCPQCNASSSKRDVRPLFVPTILAVDGEKLSALQQACDDALRGKAAAEAAMLRERAEVHRLSLELHRLRTALSARVVGQSRPPMLDEAQNVRIEAQKCEGNMAGFPSAPPSFSSFVHTPRPLRPPPAPSTSTSSGPMKPYCRLVMTGARVLEPMPSQHCLIVSSQFPAVDRVPGYGYLVVCCAAGTPLSSLRLHDKPVRDIAAQRGNTRDLLIATASLDCTLKLSTVSSKVPLASYALPQPAWACCWHPNNTNLLFCGLQNGVVLLFDIRSTSGPAGEWTPSSGSISPVHTLAPLSSVPALLIASALDVQVLTLTGGEKEGEGEEEEEIEEEEGERKKGVTRPLSEWMCGECPSQDSDSPPRAVLAPQFPGPVCSIASHTSTFAIAFRGTGRVGGGRVWTFSLPPPPPPPPPPLVSPAPPPLLLPPPAHATGHKSAFVLSRCGVFPFRGEMCVACPDEATLSVAVWKCGAPGSDAVLIDRLQPHADSVLDVKAWDSASAGGLKTTHLASLSASLLVLYRGV